MFQVGKGTLLLAGATSSLVKTNAIPWQLLAVPGRIMSYPARKKRAAVYPTTQTQATTACGQSVEKPAHKQLHTGSGMPPARHRRGTRELWHLQADVQPTSRRWQNDRCNPAHKHSASHPGKDQTVGIRHLCLSNKGQHQATPATFRKRMRKQTSREASMRRKKPARRWHANKR